MQLWYIEWSHARVLHSCVPIHHVVSCHNPTIVTMLRGRLPSWTASVNEIDSSNALTSRCCKVQQQDNAVCKVVSTARDALSRIRRRHVDQLRVLAIVEHVWFLWFLRVWRKELSSYFRPTTLCALLLSHSQRRRRMPGFPSHNCIQAYW